jgi:hypothetical protein
MMVFCRAGWMDGLMELLKALMDWVYNWDPAFSFNEWHGIVFVPRDDDEERRKKESKGYTVMNMGYDGVYKLRVNGWHFLRLVWVASMFGSRLGFAVCLYLCLVASPCFVTSRLLCDGVASIPD